MYWLWCYIITKNFFVRIVKNEVEIEMWTVLQDI